VTTTKPAACERALQTFTCDRCGACCKSLIVEAVWLDCVREPRLLKLSKLSLNDLRDETRCVLLHDGQRQCCPFLDTPDNGSCCCAIYPTRPNVCVACEPGGPSCQQARLLVELSVLRDVDGSPPDVGGWSDDGDLDPNWLCEVSAAVEAAIQNELGIRTLPTLRRQSHGRG
jgi:Fe-S-cluster containining protein